MTRPLTPEDFDIPTKSRYYLTDLARYLCRESADSKEDQHRAEEAAERTLRRECEAGRLRGLRVGRLIVIPRVELVRYFITKSTLCSTN